MSDRELQTFEEEVRVLKESWKVSAAPLLLRLRRGEWR